MEAEKMVPRPFHQSRRDATTIARRFNAGNSPKKSSVPKERSSAAHRKRRETEKISLTEKFGSIHEHWRPKVAAALNGQEVKLVKFAGAFPWHHHENEDELFLVWRGQMAIEFRNRKVILGPGEMCVVPRGVEHRTMAESEAEVLIFEPAATRNTGNLIDPKFTAPGGVRI